MSSPSSIAKAREDAQNSQKDLAEKIFLIRAGEDSSMKKKRESMGLSWHAEYPLIISQWHLDKCVYDGKDLEHASGHVSSSVLGGVEMGTGFMTYFINGVDKPCHFEQCPECNVLYEMGPSPESLEKMRTFVPSKYASIE